MFKVKIELLMRTDLALRHDGNPLVADRDLLVGVSSLKKDGGRVVTLEVRGIDFGLQKATLVTQTNDNEISVVRCTRTLGLPSVTHVVTTSRQKKVTTRTIVLITDNNSMATVTEIGKIDDFTGRRESHA
jgi:hypothetical protein